MCKYGSSCYRKNAAHRQQYRHDEDEGDESGKEQEQEERAVGEGGDEENDGDGGDDSDDDDGDDSDDAYVPEAGNAVVDDLGELNRWNKSVLKRKLSRSLSAKSVISVASTDTGLSSSQSVVAVSQSDAAIDAAVAASAAAAVEYAAAGYKWELVHMHNRGSGGDGGSSGGADASKVTNMWSGVPLTLELDPRVGRVVVGRAKNHSSSGGAGGAGGGSDGGSAPVEEYVCVAPDNGAHASARAAAAALSRRHAAFVWRAGEWWVEDMASTNGVFVNGLRYMLAPLLPELRLF
jgi:hypothetical protein